LCSVASPPFLSRSRPPRTPACTWCRRSSSNLLNATLAELAAALAAKRISSVELTKLFLARAAALNGSLNAFVTIDEERGVAGARARRQPAARAGALRTH